MAQFEFDNDEIDLLQSGLTAREISMNHSPRLRAKTSQAEKDDHAKRLAAIPVLYAKLEAGRLPDDLTITITAQP
jgi:hypothetical protein